MLGRSLTMELMSGVNILERAGEQRDTQLDLVAIGHVSNKLQLEPPQSA